MGHIIKGCLQPIMQREFDTTRKGLFVTYTLGCGHKVRKLNSQVSEKAKRAQCYDCVEARNQDSFGVRGI